MTVGEKHLVSVSRSSAVPTDIRLEHLRRFAVVRSLFTPTSLEQAIDRLGFVQADPIRAPARAQDLTLRPRVDGYQAGDLERRYHELDVEEDFFVNYGFVTRAVQALMHPRLDGRAPWSRSQGKGAAEILKFVRERGAVHPREVDEKFAHGTVTNYWGGSSNATTHLLDLMHYRGLLRIVRRDRGIRVYGIREQPPSRVDRRTRTARIDALVDVAVRKYAPLPGPSLSQLVGRLRYAIPQWQSELKPALQRARLRLSRAHVDGIDWYWPDDEVVGTESRRDQLRLLAPFDPLVWDRRRFEMFWGWPYRFEAYTPVKKRAFGYYALPLLWRDRVIGWGNLSVTDGTFDAKIGFVAGRPPRERTFRQELDAELARVREFLGY
jgi:uncharacterized protein YcaQ